MGEGLEQRLGPRRGSCSYFHHSVSHDRTKHWGTAAVAKTGHFSTHGLTRTRAEK